MMEDGDNEKVEYLIVCCSEAETATNEPTRTAGTKERGTECRGTSSLEERLLYWYVAFIDMG